MAWACLSVTAGLDSVGSLWNLFIITTAQRRETLNRILAPSLRFFPSLRQLLSQYISDSSTLSSALIFFIVHPICFHSLIFFVSLFFVSDQCHENIQHSDNTDCLLIKD